MGRVVLAAFLTAALGCSISSKKEGFLETEVSEARITTAQLRLWVHDAVLDAADRIQESADRIRANSTDPGVRRNALLWKINAIQAAFRAASRRDALGSFADLWVLCIQMKDFFEGPGGTLFGSQQDIALHTARALDARMEKTFLAVLKPTGAEENFRKTRQTVDAYAKTYPLESLSFLREPMTGHPDSHVVPAVEGLGGVVAGIEQDFVSLQRTINAYLEYLPTIARWQAELLADDLGTTAVKEVRAIGRDTVDHLIRKVVTITAAVAGCVALGLGLLVTLLRAKAAGPAPPPAL